MLSTPYFLFLLCLFRLSQVLYEDCPSVRDWGKQRMRNSTPDNPRGTSVLRVSDRKLIECDIAHRTELAQNAIR